MPAHRDFPPRLMPAPVAAHYLGVSESMLRTLGIPRRELGAKRVYDKADLDALADNLPYEIKAGETECDEAFGIS
ncbi:hypothetical protein JI58_04725 [Marinosulfonomonas sp. PRT-SC04]|nr:hypothetical protein JI58_04725 [Marinosulfonomonas sp. PRT-SC04]